MWTDTGMLLARTRWSYYLSRHFYFLMDFVEFLTELLHWFGFEILHHILAMAIR